MGHITLIGEVGINANGHIDWALKLCDMAKDAGCDVVKFQRREVEISTPRAMWDVTREFEGEVMSYIDYRRRVEFCKCDYDKIDKHCREIGIRWTASVWDIPSVDFMNQYEVPWLKIPSAKLTEHELIDYANKTGKPVVISTGMSTEEEIHFAVRHNINRTGASLMHCTSTYPANDAELNLGYLRRLKWNGFPVGFSSHSPSPMPAIYSVFEGAQSIECHITLSRALPGTDQSASLEADGIHLVRREIDRIDVVRGTGKKVVFDSEISSRKKLRGY